MIKSGSSYPGLCKIVLPKLSCMSSSLLFQRKRYVMLHDGKSLMPFVSGDILKPPKNWDQFHLPKNFLGPTVFQHPIKLCGTISSPAFHPTTLT